MFLISYVFAGTVADVHEWRENFTLTVIYSFLFVFLFILLMYWLPSNVPVFVQLMAFPPFVNETKLVFLFNVLIDDHNHSSVKRVGSHSVSSDNGGEVPY